LVRLSHNCLKLIADNASFHNLQDIFMKDDELVLGFNSTSKDFIVKVEYTFADKLILSEKSLKNIQHLDDDTQLYVHGKVGKMKTIDTNQILALCVGSLQEIISKLELNNY
jgi:hypothetical protein